MAHQTWNITVQIHWHQTVYTIAYAHSGTDHLFAQGRRLQMTRITQHENRCYQSGSC